MPNDKTTKATGATKAPTSDRVQPVVATGKIEGFSPPSKPVRQGGNTSKYPFADLEVGGYFGVKNKTRRQLLSPVSNANKRYRTELKDAAGTVVNTKQEREFYVTDVDDATAKALKGTPLEGSTVLVVRNA